MTDDIFRFAMSADVKVPLTDLVGKIVARTEYLEAEPSYVIAWEDPAEGPRENAWSETSIEPAEVLP